MVNDLIVIAFSVQGEKLLCPVCSAEEYEPDQPMVSYGDYPETLFCPHCDLTITFSQPNLGNRDVNTIWEEQCMKKFIERFKK